MKLKAIGAIKSPQSLPGRHMMMLIIVTIDIFPKQIIDQILRLTPLQFFHPSLINILFAFPKLPNAHISIKSQNQNKQKSKIKPAALKNIFQSCPKSNPSQLHSMQRTMASNSQPKSRPKHHSAESEKVPLPNGDETLELVHTSSQNDKNKIVPHLELRCTSIKSPKKTKRQRKRASRPSPDLNKFLMGEKKNGKRNIQGSPFQMRRKHETYKRRPENSDLEVLNSLEEKIHFLIEMKMAKIAHCHTGKARWSMGDEENRDEMDMEFQNLLEQIQMIKGSEQELNDIVPALEKKINLIEQLIAESTTSSELIKKMYLNQILYRKKHSQEMQPYNNSTIHPSIYSSHTNGKKNLYQESMSKSSYPKPSKEYYNIPEIKKVEKKQYQPINRSTYGHDFLNYGGLPVFRPKQSTCQLFPSFSQNKGTIYQGDFTPKKNQKMDFKELDCFRDKFRNLNISFIQKKKQLLQERLQELSDPITQPQKTRVVSRSGGSNKLKVLPIKTEHSYEFKGKPGQISSKIKDSHLEKLKYNFKQMLRA